ncbi:MAG: aldehyde dehydrogenase [Hungatella sp.]|nr:aldehyde dehydrogenase [Hungatella sp.]
MRKTFFWTDWPDWLAADAQRLPGLFSKRISGQGKTVWGKLPVHERPRILFCCAARVDEERENLARSLSSEMGKIIREARGEIRVCAQILRGGQNGQSSVRPYNDRLSLMM